MPLRDVDGKQSCVKQSSFLREAILPPINRALPKWHFPRPRWKRIRHSEAAERSGPDRARSMNVQREMSAQIIKEKKWPRESVCNKRRTSFAGIIQQELASEVFSSKYQLKRYFFNQNHDACHPSSCGVQTTSRW